VKAGEWRVDSLGPLFVTLGDYAVVVWPNHVQVSTKVSPLTIMLAALTYKK
jgi:hypothetical protein